MSSQRPESRDDFEVAIICALPREYDAVCLAFDEIWDDDDDDDDFGAVEGDPNFYLAGRIGSCNVVLVLLSRMGKTSAASAAALIRVSYRNVQLALLVGVCGGAPYGPNGEIILGDVVISKTVVQYDYGRRYAFGFVRKDTVEGNLGQPSGRIRNLLTQFETSRIRKRLTDLTANHLRDLQHKAKQEGQQEKYKYKGRSEDRLYDSQYWHKHQEDAGCICGIAESDGDPVCPQALASSCKDLGCEEQFLITRQRHQGLAHRRDYNPVVHVGAVASGDTVMKSATERDRLRSEEGVLVFEMEGAGVWDELPCIIVKGVCDYADSHKNKGWQDFAAATAASAAKAILQQYKKRPSDGAVGEQSRQRVRGRSGREYQEDEVGPSAFHTTFNGPISANNLVPAPMATHGGSVNVSFEPQYPAHPYEVTPQRTSKHVSFEPQYSAHPYEVPPKNNF